MSTFGRSTFVSELLFPNHHWKILQKLCKGKRCSTNANQTNGFLCSSTKSSLMVWTLQVTLSKQLLVKFWWSTKEECPQCLPEIIKVLSLFHDNSMWGQIFFTCIRVTYPNRLKAEGDLRLLLSSTKPNRKSNLQNHKILLLYSWN